MTGMQKWWGAAGMRALKTMAQAAIASIGACATIVEVNWGVVVSTAAIAGILSLLTSVAGIPEVEGGASVAEISGKDA